jgi:hypothetical protein
MSFAAVYDPWYTEPPCAVVDTMETPPENIPVVLVGGGAFIAPDTLTGASKVVKPNWLGVTNAIGAVTAHVSDVVDSVGSTEPKSKAQVMKDLSQRAIDTAIANGALRETVTIAEMASYPLQYIANKLRIIIKALGDFDYFRTDFEIDLSPSKDLVNGSWRESEKYIAKNVDSDDTAATEKSIYFKLQ